MPAFTALAEIDVSQAHTAYYRCAHVRTLQPFGKPAFAVADRQTATVEVYDGRNSGRKTLHWVVEIEFDLYLADVFVSQSRAIHVHGRRQQLTEQSVRRSFL